MVYYEVMDFTSTNINLYLAFAAVYETKNYSKAACDVLFCSPSSVSKNINELENQLGIKLFYSHPRGAEPTSDAIVLYEKIKPALVEIKFGEDCVKDFSEQSCGLIRFGCPAHLANYIFTDYFCEYKKRFSNIKLDLDTNPNRREMEEMLKKQGVDFIINFAPLENNDFEIIELLELKTTFFASKEFTKKYNLGNSITKDQLAKLPIVLQKKTISSINRLLQTLQIDIQPIMEVSIVEVANTMVLRGMGIGYCFEDMLVCNKDEIVKLKISDAPELPKTQIVVAYNKNSVTKPTQAFLDGLKEFCKK